MTLDIEIGGFMNKIILMIFVMMLATSCGGLMPKYTTYSTDYCTRVNGEVECSSSGDNRAYYWLLDNARRGR